MAITFISKGTVITNPSANNIGRAQFVRCVATAQTTVTVTTSDSTVSEVYLHAAGDEVIIEKHPDDTLTSSGAKVHAVGSPRS
jgi:hypothetical protein